MRTLLTLSACLFLGGNLLATEGPTRVQGGLVPGESANGSHPATTVTAHQQDTARRIAELEAQRSAGGDEESLQRQIMAVKAESELQRLELLVQECLAAGRTEEAALAQGELERRRTLTAAGPAGEWRELSYEEKAAQGTLGSTGPVPAPATAVPSTTEGGR
jgi:hypothetical protein